MKNFTFLTITVLANYHHFTSCAYSINTAFALFTSLKGFSDASLLKWGLDIDCMFTASQSTNYATVTSLLTFPLTENNYI